MRRVALAISAFESEMRQLTRVVFGGLAAVVALASIAAVAALFIDLSRVLPDTTVASAQVSVVASPGVSAARAADLVTARKSATGSRSTAQGAASGEQANPTAPGTEDTAFVGVPAPPASDQERYEPVARAAAAKYDLDPNVFVRQITKESHWDPTIVSPAGAQGIAQFMPSTAASLGVDPLDPIAALEAAAEVDHENLIAFDGDYAKMLAAYNAGRGSVLRYGGVPPFRETQNYVWLILGTDPL